MNDVDQMNEVDQTNDVQTNEIEYSSDFSEGELLQLQQQQEKEALSKGIGNAPTKWGPVTIGPRTPLGLDLIGDEAREIETQLSNAELGEAQTGYKFQRDGETGLINEFNKPGLRFDANRSHDNFTEIKSKILSSYPTAEVLRFDHPVNGSAIGIKLPNEEGMRLFDNDSVTTFSDIAEGAGYLLNYENLAAIASSLATKNMGTFMRMFSGGVAGSAGRAVDEGIEHIRGYQSDPIDDIFFSEVLPAGAAGVLGEALVAPVTRLAKVPRLKGFIKELSETEKRGVRTFKEAEVYGPSPGTLIPFLSAAEKQAVATDRSAKLVALKQAESGYNDLTRMRNRIEAPDRITDEELDKIVEDSVGSLKDLLVGTRDWTREAGGRALQQGKKNFKTNYSKHLTRKFDRADDAAKGAIFDIEQTQDIIDTILTGTGLTDATTGDKILIDELSPAFRKELGKIKASTRLIAKRGGAEGNKQLRELRTRFFELKEPKPGERHTNENRLAGQVWNSLTEVMNTPIGGRADFALLQKSANLSNSRYESILEVTNIARVTKETEPGKLLDMIQPGNSYSLRTMKRVMPAADWETFTRSYHTKLIRDPTKIRAEIEKFKSDPESLKTMMTPSEQKNLLELGDGITSIEKSVKEIKHNKLGRRARAREVIQNGNVDTIETLLEKSGGKDGDFGKSLRSAVIQSIQDSAEVIQKGYTGIRPEQAIAKIRKLEQNGILQAVMTPTEIEGLKSRQIMYSLFMDTPDTGASLQAAQIISNLTSVFSLAELTKGKWVFSALHKSFSGASSLAKNWLVGSILLSPAAQRAIIGAGGRELDVTTMRILSGITTHAAHRALNQANEDKETK